MKFAKRLIVFVGLLVMVGTVSQPVYAASVAENDETVDEVRSRHAHIAAMAVISGSALAGLLGGFTTETLCIVMKIKSSTEFSIWAGALAAAGMCYYMVNRTIEDALISASEEQKKINTELTEKKG